MYIRHSNFIPSLIFALKLILLNRYLNYLSQVINSITLDGLRFFFFFHKEDDTVYYFYSCIITNFYWSTFYWEKVGFSFLLFIKCFQSEYSVYEFVHTWYGSVNRFCDHCVALYCLPTNDRRCSGNYMKFSVWFLWQVSCVSWHCCFFLTKLVK